MNYENYDYLISNVFLKFGVRGELDESLERAMKKQPQLEQINLDYKMIIDRPETKTKDTAEFKFNLDFNEDKNSYYLNSIDAKLTKVDGTNVEQRFKLFSQTGLNLIQMANVMDGRFAYREYQRWDKDLGQSMKESGWFFRGRLGEDGKPLVSVLNDQVTKFSIFEAMGMLPLNLTQKQKNEMILQLKEGNPVYSRIPMPDGTAMKIELTVNPRIGIQAHTMDGERVRWKKVEGKVVFDIDKKTKINETTAKVVEKSLETGITGRGNSKKIA